MREKLSDPLPLSVVMGEYLTELEQTCHDYQATLTEGGFSFAQGGEQ